MYASSFLQALPSSCVEDAVEDVSVMRLSVCSGRLYQTAAVAKRMVKPNDVIVSIDGSPLMHSDHSNDAVLVPVNDSQVSLSLSLSFHCAFTIFSHRRHV